MQLSAEQLAATAIDDNLVVNAGAGSGKTTVLTHRYVRLLAEGGLNPGEIVAITFTKKAAREMRERIAQRLQGNEQARDALTSAPIGTIHSFYAGILRTFPVEAGIDPGFRVLEEMEAGMLLSDALGKVLESDQEANPHLGTLASILGAQAMEEGGALSQQLLSTYQTLLSRGIPVEEAILSSQYDSLPPWQQSRDRYVEIISGEAALAAELGDWDKPEFASKRSALVEAAAILQAARDPRDLLAAYPKLFPLTSITGGNTKGHKQFVKGATENLRQLLTGALAPVLGEATFSLLANLDREFRRYKARAGGLDFADLQFKVWRLLQTNPQIVRKLRSRYRMYMLDEFQDTDRLQYSIITMLVEEGGEIPPGRLFVVGDEKQSIYRFRGAEVRVFDAVRRRLTKDNPEREKQITCNYRSRQPLIDMVNGLFSRLMDQSKGSEIKYTKLTAHRVEEGCCAELATCVPGEGESTAEAEAHTLATKIEELVTGDGVTIGSSRPYTFGDIAVLVRARTHLKEYEHNLRLAGIPYTVVGGVGYYQQQEVQDIINLLRVVDNLRDELSLTAVLRSPLFALDDDSLLALARARREQGGTLLDHGHVLNSEPHRRLERAAGIIAELRSSRGALEVPHLVALAFDLTQAREFNLTRFAGLQRHANLEKFLGLAEKYSAAGNNHLTGFLQWLQHAAGTSEAEAQVDSEESDSVKIMTIHASKGLEFPVVILPSCSTGLNPSYGSMLVDDEGHLAFKYPWDCAIWQQACAQERQSQEEEYKRILYVAVTRARDKFVALVKETERKETSLNYWLQEFAADSPQHFHLTQPGQQGGLNIQLPSPLPQPLAGEDKGIETILPGLATLGTARAFRYFTITQFMLWCQDRQQFHRRYLSRWLETEPISVQTKEEGWEHEPGGASFGSLLHQALEVISAETDVPSLVGTLLPEFFPQATREQRDRIFYSAKTLLEAYQKEPGPQGEFSQSLSEQVFYYRLGDALFHGLIDRVLIAQGHVAILDYKSNRIPQGGIGPLLEMYTPQLQFYALAAQRIYQKPVRAYLQLLRRPPGQQLAEVSLGTEQMHRLQTELEDFVRYCQG